MDQTRSQSPEPPGPKPIRRLHESLINRIAAGEIIHRPASALKELIENSLDAGSTSIRVTVKDGGMKLLQIQDNGSGIRKTDLPLLAERFATSKISTFSDLSQLTTYGFRGEALASISHVAHLSVITKTESDTCAWKACYEDGSLVPVKAGLTPDPKPCAGNEGTTIIVEDLFYNTPTRLSALRSSSEEYARILDVITKYAVHNSTVSFTCKKGGSPSADLSTPSGSTTQQAIRLLYGHSVAKELIHVSEQDDPEAWSAEAYVTSASYQAKKIVLLLFINNRLVDSSRIKRSLEAVYSSILPKGASPYIYLSLHIDPRSVDVNVHPTKREVHFLNEDMIIEDICDAIQEALAGRSHSRVFEYQVRCSPETFQTLKRKRTKIRHRPLVCEPALKKKVYSHHKVRTSTQDRTLDSMFPVVNPSQIITPPSGGEGDASPQAIKLREIKQSECYLTSVQHLRREVEKARHKHLTEILDKHIFVGIVDVKRCLSLIQHSTRLYLLNHDAFAYELFYQLGLRQFGNMSRFKLNPPPALKTMIKLAVDAEEGTTKSRYSKEQIVEIITSTLIARREMLQEYFSLGISENGAVEYLPLLLRGYTPNLDKLPSFLMRLGPQVDWTSEKECFETFLRELALFYVPGPLVQDSSDGVPDEEKAERWQVEHVLFPSLRRYLCPPKTLLDQDIVQVANLPDLYRVFERC
ncbi:DNA mismatch repair protein MutL [Gloeophyllum trabeum ATCC 11539]|uniref:DNA mismatch repair protein MutL n=1 Tax=Gloeophyllum trabeum (strain ATCC 11539 / FP-39264 / Madison 617) TaxID=670483 RepID=S7RLM7_GLOTA|nr:DNA mismatch repair protein MutL [Gloeophyllum trabeum ATCC 11539]EPQ53579.1 DNA mismatch repair protein MutL [Gloeophyllum trabeum ATCC 11539]